MYLLDYANKYADKCFEETPVNFLDYALFSQIIQNDLDTIVPLIGDNKTISIAELCEIYFEKPNTRKRSLGLIIPSEIIYLLKILKTAKRYQNFTFSKLQKIYDSNIPQQFMALTIDINENESWIVFAGTDDSLAGWQEDFELIHDELLKCHIDAINYTNNVMDFYDNSHCFTLIGHSKGGNLALECFIALLKKQNKINKVVTFDAPGVSTASYEKLQYLDKQKIFSLYPETSIIGRLFSMCNTPIIVKSKNKALYQHDVFSWLCYDNEFVRSAVFDNTSDEVNFVINEIITGLSNEEKGRFVADLFDILCYNNIKNLNALKRHFMSPIQCFIKFDWQRKVKFSAPLIKLLKNNSVRKVLLQTIVEFKKANHKKQNIIKKIKK